MHFPVKKVLACAVTAVMAAGMLAGCGSTKIDGTQTLITVNGESEDLGVGSFLAKYQQASIYKYWGTYFGSSGELFDTVYDSSASETYGDTLKDSVIEDLKLMLCMRQHADDYNVSLTDEETTEIENAAQSYIDNNDEKVRNMIGASKDDVIEAMTLQTIQSKMMDPIVADVDTTVDDSEVQQTSVTYVTVSIPDSSDTDSSADSSDADSSAASSAESAADSSASSTSSTAENVESKVAALEEAQSVLDAVSAESDVANADMDSIASGIDSNLAAYSGRFTTNDPTDTTLDSAIVDSVSGLEDGTLVDHVVESSDGTNYYVVRLDKNFDEDGTESERNSKIIQKKQDAYDEITQGWVDEATVEVNEEAWATVVLSDSDPITLTDSEAESSSSSASSGAESAASTAASGAESTASTAESAAAASDSLASSAASAAGSTVSGAGSAASSAASAAESGASSAASAAESAASSVVSAAS